MTLPRIEEAFLEDGNGPSATLFHNGASVASLVVSNVSARLFLLRAIVDTGIDADRIIQVFDLVALPADGTEPLWEMLIQANPGFAEAGDDFAPIKGLAFANGITLAVSTTKGILTIAVQSEVSFFGSFVPVG